MTRDVVDGASAGGVDGAPVDHNSEKNTSDTSILGALIVMQEANTPMTAMESVGHSLQAAFFRRRPEVQWPDGPPWGR